MNFMKTKDKYTIAVLRVRHLGKVFFNVLRNGFVIGTYKTLPHALKALDLAKG